jgi:hypothetical protein
MQPTESGPSGNPDPNVQAPALDKGVLSSLQVPTSPNAKSPYASVIPSTIALTADIYWASFPMVIQKSFRTVEPQTQQPGDSNVFTPPTPQQLLTACMNLAMQGYLIDFEIMAFGNDPVVFMLERQEMNLPSVPSLLTNKPIKTSLDPADYPPFYPPAPPAVTAPATPPAILGTFQGYQPTLGGMVYSAGPGALPAIAAGQLVDGGTYSTGGVTYTFHITMGLMGETVWFTLVG